MKNICKILLILFIIITLTACKKEEKVKTNIQERQVSYKGTHTLTCKGTSKEEKTKTTMRSTITYDYDNKELVEGTIEVKLQFQKKLTEEDKSNLKDMSFCSSDMMGNLSAYGECNTEIKEKELISVLIIKKEELPLGYSLEKMKEDLEKTQNMVSTCTIK